MSSKNEKCDKFQYLNSPNVFDTIYTSFFLYLNTLRVLSNYDWYIFGEKRVTYEERWVLKDRHFRLKLFDGKKLTKSFRPTHISYKNT